MDPTPPLADAHPETWTFHRLTSRWPFNSSAPGADAMPRPGREDTSRPFTALPAARWPEASLGMALDARTSCRRFAPAPVPLDDVATLLCAAYGIKGSREFGAIEMLERATPSGGGLYPLELSLVAHRIDGLDAGIYHYVPATHGLEQLRQVALPTALCRYLFMGQDWAAEAAAILVFSAVFERSMRKYGDRGYRYLLIEAGHAAQNVNLVAAASRLGSCNLGGFFDVELASLLCLDIDVELPVYAVAVGAFGADPREAAMPT
jgi:SagB-type dehydrogenase family enzyme